MRYSFPDDFSNKICLISIFCAYRTISIFWGVSNNIDIFCVSNYIDILCVRDKTARSASLSVRAANATNGTWSGYVQHAARRLPQTRIRNTRARATRAPRCCVARAGAQLSGQQPCAHVAFIEENRGAPGRTSRVPSMKVHTHSHARTYACRCQQSRANVYR